MKTAVSNQRIDKPGSESGSHSPMQQRRVLCSVLLALATILLYSPVRKDPFLNIDDGVYVTANPHVRDGFTWDTFVWAFRTSEATNWHPITWLSHALDCQIFGLSPAGPHIVNIVLHAANAVILFLLLETATGFLWRSLSVAALFALHPINVESVAWIAERKNVLSMFFFLLALAAYGWYARKRNLRRYLIVTFAYALGLLTKPQVITFPFALLLLDYWPLRRWMASEAAPKGRTSIQFRSWTNLIWEKVPWFAMSAASAVITMRVQEEAKQVNLPLWVHLGNAAISYARYLEKTFWPAHLAIVYPHPQFAISVPGAWLSACGIIGLSVIALIFRRCRPLFVGWFWFLGTLVPMIGLVQVGSQAMADRYAYIPTLGIFVILCWGSAELAQRWHVPKTVLAVSAAVVFVTLGIALRRQVSFWRDNVTLWTHTVAITEDNFVAEDNLGTALIDAGRIEEALPHLQRTLQLRPDDPEATLNIATYQQMHGNLRAALDGYAKVFQLTKDSHWVGTARVNSGYAHLSLKDYVDAEQDFESALNQQPTNSKAYRGLALLEQRTGQIAKATEYYTQSVRLQPTPVGYLLLGQALELAGRPQEARAAQSRAAAMSQDLNREIATTRLILASY